MEGLHGMFNYIIRRIGASIVVFICVSFIIMSFIRLLPGDPIAMMMGKHPVPEIVDVLRKFYHLDKPLVIQYFLWWQNLLKGNLGVSYVTGIPVLKILFKAVQPTIVITVLCTVFSTLVGLIAGIISAVKRNTYLDYIVTLITFSGISMPSFFLGIFLIWVFTIKMNLLPPTGYLSPLENFIGSWKYLIMPVFAQGFQSSSGITRMVRSSFLEVLGQDFIRTARAKGQKEIIVIMKHALRNALIPVITMISLQLARLMGGIIIIESVFAIPGMGRTLLNSIYRRDYPMIQASILMITLIFLVANLMADLLYAVVDPRIKYV